MFTVIIQNKRSSDLLTEYKFLFKPFIDNQTLAFCDWNEAGTDIRTSVPDLYNLVKGKQEWRAILLDTNSVYDYKDCLRPSKQNPFDYSKQDRETLPHESPIPIIRLSHIIGGYTAAPIKEFEKGFEFMDDETGQMTRVLEADLSEEEIRDLSDKYYDSLTPVYIEKKNEEYERLQTEMEHKYAFTNVRPTEIQLIATRRKLENNEKAQIVESWRNHLEMTSSSFWESNKYPNNCRFLYYEITNTENTFFTKELTEFWLSVLTLATNKIAASSLQAYRLYRLHVDVSREELKLILNQHLNKMTSAYGFVKDQLKMRPEYSFDEDEQIVSRQNIPVVIEKNEGKDLYVHFGKVGLSCDHPEDEKAFWDTQVRVKKANLDQYLKMPRRAIDKSAKKLKVKAESFTGEHYELDRFQMSDLKEVMDDLESKIISAGMENTLDRKKINEEIADVDKQVKKELGFRLNRLHILLAGGAALLLTLAGMLPYLISSAVISSETFTAALGLTLFILGGTAVGGLIALLFQRFHIIRIMRQFNDLMRKIVGNVRSYAGKFEENFSDICTYMKAQSILDGVDMRKENAISHFGIMNSHRLALQSAIARDEDWLASYGLARTDELIPRITSFFKYRIIPRENPLYYFDINCDDADIPVNSTGDLVTAPYKFVEKLWIEREELFDESEVTA